MGVQQAERLREVCAAGSFGVADDPHATRLFEVETLMEALALEASDGLASGMLREHLQSGGKRLRARLVLSALEALGCDPAKGTGWAAACELLHNATLIHDDIQDGDRTRRGHPALWARYGTDQAMNAGDLMLMLPFLAILRVPIAPEIHCGLVRTLATYATGIAGGQIAEREITRNGTVDWKSYRRAAAGKTSGLVMLAVEGAALLAGRSDAQAKALALAVEPLGVLLQLQDDVLDLYGDKGRNERGSDLREGKISALVVEHLRLHPADTSWLLGVLGTPRNATPNSEVEKAIYRFRVGGALAAVLSGIRREVEALCSALALHREAALRVLALDFVNEVLRPIRPLLDLPLADDVLPVTGANHAPQVHRAAGAMLPA